MALEKKQAKAQIVGSAVEMGDVDYWIKDPSYYSLDWYNNAAEGVGDSPDNPYLISSAQDLAGLSYLVYKNPRGLENYNSTYVFSGKYFKQTTDINLSAHIWQPIGIEYDRNGNKQSNYFSGNYNGAGFSISGVNTPAGDTNAYSNQGLFGYVQGKDYTRYAHIDNVGINNSIIGGLDSVGPIVGYANIYTVITNYFNSGIVEGRGVVGGVVGKAKDAAIRYCYNSGTVNCFLNSAGGVVGSGSGTNLIIQTCYNVGTVSGGSFTGGITGYVSDYPINPMLNCYNAGSIIGTDKVGGVGGNVDRLCRINNCYNSGSVSGSSNYVGGVVGSGGRILNCFNVGSVEGTGNNVGGVVGSGTILSSYYGGDCQNFYDDFYISDIEQKAQEINWYNETDQWDVSSPWDFENVWLINSYSGNLYPIIRKLDDGIWSEQNYELDFNWTGDGSLNNPYKISSIGELAAMSYIVYYADSLQYRLNTELYKKFVKHIDFTNSYRYCISGTYFMQTKNIDLSTFIWQPIGVEFGVGATNQFSYFAGNYNGTGHSISSVTAKSEGDSSFGALGFFAYVQGKDSNNTAVVQNITMIESSIQGTREYERVGGVVGYAGENAIVSNCSYDGVVSNYMEDSTVGGVVGYVSGAKVKNCLNTGRVETDDINSSAGGIIGECFGIAEIEGCYNKGDIINSKGYAGGIVGRTRELTIQNCYNTGNVNGNVMYLRAGGIVGSVFYGDLIMQECFNTGDITGNNAGGLVGLSNSRSVTIDSCFNTGAIRGYEAGGLINSCDGELVILNCYNSGDVSGDVAGGLISRISNIVNYITTIKNSFNIGTISSISRYATTNAYRYLGGIVGYVVIGAENRLYITQCANFGNIELDSRNCVAGGMLSYGSITGSFIISECYSEGTISVQYANATVGGLIGSLAEDYQTNENVKIEFCAVNLNVKISGSGSISSQGGFYGDVNGIAVGNSYAFLNNSLTLSEVTESMDGKFAYINGFKNGKPLPVSLFFILVNGEKTGIVEKINSFV